MGIGRISPDCRKTGLPIMVSRLDKLTNCISLMASRQLALLTLYVGAFVALSSVDLLCLYISKSLRPGDSCDIDRTTNTADIGRETHQFRSSMY